MRFLELRAVAYVGTISYGIYLLHMVAIDLVNRLSPFSANHAHEATFLLAWGLSIAMAGFSFRYFERPILEFKDRFRSAAGLPLDPKTERKGQSGG